MKSIFFKLSIFTIFLVACRFFPGPRSVDGKKEWKKNQTKLKILTQDILEKGNKTYIPGINNFPKSFDYPFDDGFEISRNFSTAGTETDTIDTKKVTIKFYVDRGLLDHYSAIIYTNDSSVIYSLDLNVENGGNDFKIEPNWYMIND